MPRRSLLVVARRRVVVEAVLRARVDERLIAHARRLQRLLVRRPAALMRSSLPAKCISSRALIAAASAGAAAAVERHGGAISGRRVASKFAMPPP